MNKLTDLQKNCIHNWIVTSGSRAKQEVIVTCNLCRLSSTVINPTSEELIDAESAIGRPYKWLWDMNRIVANVEKAKEMKTIEVIDIVESLDAIEVTKDIPQEPVKQETTVKKVKRKRRTKAEIEADKLKKA